MNRRRLSLAAAVTVGLMTLSACGTGFDAQTNQQYQAGVGADLRTGPVQVLGAVVVTDEDGSAVVSATVLNTTDLPQSLLSVRATGPDGTELPVISTRQLTTLQPDEALRLGAEGGPLFKLSKVKVDRYIDLTFVFDDAGDIDIHAPAVVRDADYDDVVGSKAAEQTVADELASGSSPITIKNARFVILDNGRAVLRGKISTAGEADGAIPSIEGGPELKKPAPSGIAGVTASDEGRPLGSFGYYIDAAEVEIGDVLTVTFAFESSGTVTVDAPVVVQ